MYQMKLMQNAGGDAWMDLAKGAEEAWSSMREALAKAESHFKR
jgi:hypothetical protein